MVRSKPATSIIRRRRLTRGTRASDHFGPLAEAPTGQPRSRRHGGPSQDTALYTCHCGYVFDALVSTSVGCPHCGRTQAW
ncbi:MAG: hypothetical protein E6G05_15705 [Actinobacteria bacterium]|nr:MAG: hypothetical protein E6G05_15705 [Actinomycetota bacterium]